MARLKTINKYLLDKIPDKSFKKYVQFYDCRTIPVTFFIAGELQTTHYFTYEGFLLFFKEVLNTDFDIFIKKILLFKKNINERINKYPVKNPFENNTYNSYYDSDGSHGIEVHYFNKNKIDISNPDMFVLKYGICELHYHTKRNGAYAYKEEFNSSKFYFDKNFNMNVLIYKFLKYIVENEGASFITTPVNESNVQEYLSLLKIISYQ